MELMVWYSIRILYCFSIVLQASSSLTSLEHNMQKPLCKQMKENLCGWIIRLPPWTHHTFIILLVRKQVKANTCVTGVIVNIRVDYLRFWCQYGYFKRIVAELHTKLYLTILIHTWRQEKKRFKFLTPTLKSSIRTNYLVHSFAKETQPIQPVLSMNTCLFNGKANSMCRQGFRESLLEGNRNHPAMKNLMCIQGHTFINPGKSTLGEYYNWNMPW